MKIDANQLQTWANPPSSGKHITAHEQVRRAIDASSALNGRKIEVFLQGSYANSTNIRAESDVDIVVQLSSNFYANKEDFSEFERSLYDLTFTSSSYGWTQFKADVYVALVNHFGAENVKDGTKCIKVKGNDSRVHADVIPGIKFRKYTGFNLGSENDYVEGVKFWTKDNTPIINYPKIHIDNGQQKNHILRTRENYKDTVRILKNMTVTMLDEYGVDRKVAPSYFLECSVYNAPDNYFHSDHVSNFESFLNFIMRECNAEQMRTVSHQHALFGDEPWQWNQAQASEFFDALEKYYITRK